jgi:hypothetical protein
MPKIEIMSIAVLVLPGHFAASTCSAVATLVIEIQPMLPAERFELWPDDGFQQATDDLSELVRR